MNTTKNRIAYYGRQSGDKGDESLSLEGQVEQLEAARIERGGTDILIKDIRDPGGKRWAIDRPGLRELIDLARDGKIDEVWAYRTHRYGQHPIPDILKMQLAPYGVRVRSLDEAGTGLMADAMDTMKAVFAGIQLQDTIEHSRIAKIEKAKRGKVVGGHSPNYGFNHSPEDADTYELDPEKMAHVKEIISLAASGTSLRGIMRTLHDKGIPSPRGKEWWSTQTIHRIIEDDCYRPHAYTELKARIADERALANLDPHRRYGLVYYGKRKTHLVMRDGELKQDVQWNPQEQWYAIPVPDSGLDPGVIDRARANIKDNRRFSSAGNKLWELSGLMRCSGCGRIMQTYRKRIGQKDYHYYYCPAGKDLAKDCTHKKYHRAEPLEASIFTDVEGYLSNPQEVKASIERTLKAEREAIRSGEVERDLATFEKELEKAKTKRDRLLDIYLDGKIDSETFEERSRTLEAQSEAPRAGIERARGRLAEVDALERQAQALIAAHETTYAKNRANMSPENRHKLYRMMHLDVSMPPSGDYSLSTRFSANGTRTPLRG